MGYIWVVRLELLALWQVGVNLGIAPAAGASLSIGLLALRHVAGSVGNQNPSHWENRCLTFSVSRASYGLKLVGNLSLHRAGKPGAFPPLSPR